MAKMNAVKHNGFFITKKPQTESDVRLTFGFPTFFLFFI